MLILRNKIEIWIHFSNLQKKLFKFELHNLLEKWNVKKIVMSFLYLCRKSQDENKTNNDQLFKYHKEQFAWRFSYASAVVICKLEPLLHFKSFNLESILQKN